MAQRSTISIVKSCKVLIEELLSFVGKYPKVKERIDWAIKIKHPLHVKSPADHGAWGKLYREEDFSLSQKKDFDWWLELESLLKFAVNQYKAGRNTTPINARPAHTQRLTTVRYGVFPCQDTILPLYFEDAYLSKDFKVVFKKYNSWDEGLSAFLNNDIDVALHNFPTVVAYNSLYPKRYPLVFWPFFNFNGYGIFVKTATVKAFLKSEGRSYSSFKNLPLELKRKFFLSEKILVERTTDFEWALKNFCKNNLDITDDELLKLNVIDCNTNLAKIKFTEYGPDHSVYCTNSIHIHDLASKQDANGELFFELVAHGSNLTSHRNFNGLICSSQFFASNEPIVHELVNKWFLHTDAFLYRLNKALHPNALEPFINFTIPNLVQFLNKETESAIEIADLAHIYDPSYNYFYQDPATAFEEFYLDLLENPEFLKNNISITKLALNGRGDITDEQIEKSINAIKDSMSNPDL